MRFLRLILVVFFLCHPALAAPKCSELLSLRTTTLEYSPRPTKVDHLVTLSAEQRARFFEIQELANRDGLTIVAPDFSDLVSMSQSSLFQLFGTNVVLVKESDARGRKLPGVVLHLGIARELYKAIQGKLNPAYTNKLILKKIEIGDKYLDYALVERVAPGEGLMAKTLRVDKNSEFDSYLRNEGPNIKSILASALGGNRRSFTAQERIVLENFIKGFFSVAESLLGPSFVKYIEEARTGDTKDTIMTFKTDAEKVVETFESDFFKSKTEIGASPKELTTSAFLNALKEKEHNATQLFRGLLFRPQDLMVQEKLDVLAEVRVDGLYGIPLSAAARYGYDFFPPELLQAAMDFTAKFFARLPSEWKHISGGVDVAFVADPNGMKMKFMEFNFGTDSNFIWAKSETIEANEWISKITGRPTPLLQILETSFLSGYQGQAELIRTLRPRYLKAKRSIKDISKVEYGSWLVYRYMEQWDGTRPDAQRIRQSIARVFAGNIRGSPELAETLRSLDLYIARIP